MSDLFYKVGDTSPPLEATLRDANGPVDLTGASVRLHINRQHATKPFLNVAASIVNPNQPPDQLGKVRYQWESGDLSEAGNFDVEWFVTWADGAEATFPNAGYGKLVVQRRLGS
jgi:hypothetical protein